MGFYGSIFLRQRGRKDMIENYDSRKGAEWIKQFYKKVLSKK